MVFVADDLGAWLVGLLADAGRKKLTTLVVGSDQQRALRQAAIAAVQDTAEEMSPSGSEEAGQLAMVISEVFREPMPDARLAGLVTLLEGLQAAIAGQLAVLDDAGLTGTGQSSADVLEVSGTVLAERLTAHLVREIMLRGSRGGPLTPLADQLNHDRTHLQGQRVEGMLARLANEARDAPVRPDNGAAAGRPLGEMTDPFALEVHRPVQPDDPQCDLPTLPVYVPREHDRELGRVVAAAESSSRIAVLVGGSSTGKTRACWEALQLLRDQKPGWRLWHPIDPSRPDAALHELSVIGPRTVVWLNEAQFYLDVGGGLGERVAAGLRELLRDPARGPVLVLATLWPSFWDALTTRPAADRPDPHAQARELLAGRDITVPAAFTPAELQRLGEAGDVRLAQAAAGARDGQVIQFLAGAPELLARYSHAPPAAKALIDAAMDARRLGMRPALPQAFLEAAVAGYLTGSDWDLLAEDWLEQALAYTDAPCKGVRGPLARIRPRPARRAAGNGDPAPGLVAGSVYRLADYLDQVGRRSRREQIPPAAFWAAAARYADRDDLGALGDAARDRGLYRDAVQLYKHATAHGDTFAAARLVTYRLHLTDQRPGRWCVAHAALDDPSAVAHLLRGLREAGAGDQVTALLARDPAAHGALDDPSAVAYLLDELREAGAGDQVTALAGRAAAHAAHAALDDPSAVAYLLRGLRAAGAGDQVTALLARDPAAHAALDDPRAVADLLGELRWAGAGDQVTALAGRAAAHAALDDPSAVAYLLRGLRAAGAGDQVTALLTRAAAHAILDDPSDVVNLMDWLREAGAGDQVTALAGRVAAHATLDDPIYVAYLLDELREAGAGDQVTALLARDPAAHAALDDPSAVAYLLRELRAAGAGDQVTALLTRDPAAHAALDDPSAVADLLDELREAGAGDQVTALLARDPAAHAALDDLYDVADLLGELREAGAGDQVTALAGRAAAHATLDNPRDVAALLRELRKAGAQEQAEALIDRLPAAGMFQLFCEQEGHQERFWFGQEADGDPAGPWGWEDLD